MTRTERRMHAWVWLVLTPLLVMVLAAGLWQRAVREPPTPASGVGR